MRYWLENHHGVNVEAGRGGIPIRNKSMTVIIIYSCNKEPK